MGSSRERAVQKKINGRIAEAEKLDQDFDAVLSEIYGATGLPIRTADQLELETREMKDQACEDPRGFSITHFFSEIRDPS